ncbi:MAG: DUF3179 domain-containing (seleno)protein, partial [Planctomycetota bacterium]
PRFNPVFNLDNLTLPAASIRSGGPAIDGIPSLTTEAARPDQRFNPAYYGEHPPRLEPIDGSTLPPTTRVVTLTLHNQTRVYPINILNFHEIINDTLTHPTEPEQQTHVAIVYCPLCDSVTVFDRTLNNTTYEFGVSGLLHKSNVLLYDRTDHALWSQLGLAAVSGPNAGVRLQTLNHWKLTTLGAARQAHPVAQALTLHTGFERDYAANPYANYFNNDGVWFGMEPSKKLMPNKQKIVGIRIGNKQRAYKLETVAKLGTLHDTLAGRPVTIRIQPDRTLTVTQAPPDAQITHTFWFAWQAFWPDTEVYSPPHSAQNPPDFPK